MKDQGDDDMVKLTLLGTGSPTPLLHRAGSSYLVEFGEERMLVDCGPFAVHRLLEAGVPPVEITSLLLTHLHYDHAVDYGYLVLNRWDQGVGTIPDLPVFGPPPIERMTERFFGTDGVWGPDLDARTNHAGSHFVFDARGGDPPRVRPEPVVTTVGHGEVIERDGWTVRVAEVVHVQPQLTCLAYRLEVDEKVIVFGGDSAPTPNLTELARGADVLLHMCHFVNGVVVDPRLTECCSGHLDSARTARDAGVDTLVLVHITEQVEKPGVREQVIREAAEIFDGRIIFGEDLTEVPLDAPGVDAIR